MNEGSQLVAYQLTGLGEAQGSPPPDLPPGVVLHPANLPADLPAINEIYQVVFGPPAAPNLAAGQAGDQAELASLIRHPGLAPPGIFLALEGELPVGLGVGRVEVPAAGDGTRRAAVELLAVRPDYRRQGIGRALLCHLLGWLAERGVQIVLASTDDPVVAALLENHGFQASTAP